MEHPKGKISSLHFEVVPFPQRNTDTNTWVTPSYYWARVVNTNSEHIDLAWDFIKFAASQEQMKVYGEATHIPPARQDLIGEVNLGSTKYDIFSQALPYAKSWVKGDPDTGYKVFVDAINDVAGHKKDSQAALKRAAEQLEQILKEYEVQYVAPQGN